MKAQRKRGRYWNPWQGLIFELNKIYSEKIPTGDFMQMKLVNPPRESEQYKVQIGGTTIHVFTGGGTPGADGSPFRELRTRQNARGGYPRCFPVRRELGHRGPRRACRGAAAGPRCRSRRDQRDAEKVKP